MPLKLHRGDFHSSGTVNKACAGYSPDEIMNALLDENRKSGKSPAQYLPLEKFEEGPIQLTFRKLGVELDPNIAHTQLTSLIAERTQLVADQEKEEMMSMIATSVKILEGQIAPSAHTQLIMIARNGPSLIS